jgi:hypothetical protein
MKVTFSGVERVMACAPAAVLPHSREVREPALRGNAIHDFLFNLNSNARDKALLLVPDKYREACESIDLEKLPPPGSGAGEVAFAYDTRADTARELGRGLNRNYGQLSPWEIAGTVDWVGVSGSMVVVVDFKSGFGEVTAAPRNAQLRIGALASARAYGCTSARVAIAKVRDNFVWWDWAEFDALDLDAIAAEVRAMTEAVDIENKRVAGGQSPNTVQGLHCRYCPAFTACPAKMNLVLAVVHDAQRGAELPTLSEANFPAVLDRLEAAEAALKRVRETVEEYATATPVMLPNGDIYGPVETPRETIDAEKAGSLLASRFPGVSAQAMEPKMTKTKLIAALKKAGANPDLALDMLRRGGAIKETVSIQVKRFKNRDAA